MDPLTALSLAGTIVQFVDFASKIVRATVSGRALPVHEELETRTIALRDFVAKLRRPPNPEDTSMSINSRTETSDKTLQELCDGCAYVADELLARLDRSRVDGKHQMWKNFQNAIKSVWSQKELDSLSRRLAGFRKSLDTHVLSNLNDTTNAIALQQSMRFDQIDRKTQSILEALLESKHTRSEDVYDQNLAAAQLLSRTEVVVSGQDDKTRAVVHTKQLLSQAKEEHINSAERDKAAKIQNEEVELQALAEENVLDSMSFESMAHREEEIAAAHRNTFLWMLHPESRPSLQKHTWANFIEWLKSGRGTYWINGKAGSGKSTLMRFICKSEVTGAALRQWSDSSPLTVGNFFFWNSGTLEQRSQTGLLRTLLHDILRQNRDLIPIVMPSVWARAYSNAVQPDRRSKSTELSRDLLMKAFKALVIQRVKQLKLCLFIDGLDEYEGDPSDMADLFTDLVELDNIKVCLSSRPLVPLEYAFKSSPNIRLQDLTCDDITLYINDKLCGNKKFQQLATHEPEKAPALVNEIVNKADGVFLWVVLVVRSLLVGLNNRDGMDDLERRLAELPGDISALFENMLTKRIAPFYQTRGASLFQIMRASRERNDEIEGSRQFPMEIPPPLTVLTLSFADEKNPEWALKAPVRPLNESEKSVRCNSMEDRLKNCCAGLLEVQGAYDEVRGLSRIGDTPPDGKVQYLHRTVRDYLHQHDVWKTVTAKTEGSDFEPHVSLLRSYILHLKAAEIKEKQPITDITWKYVAIALDLARQAELKDQSAYIPLLDELDLVIASLLRQTKGFYRRHWSYYYKLGVGRPYDWNDTMLAVAVEYGLSTYLDFKFRQSGKNPREKKGRPLLDIAVSSEPSEQRYPIYPPTVVVLLKHGANPNVIYKGRTPWQNALRYGYSLQTFKSAPDSLGTERIKPNREEAMNTLCLFKHFIDHGADLSPNERRYGSTPSREAVLWLVTDVIYRWYPDEAAALVEDLQRRSSSGGILSGLSAAWKRARQVVGARVTDSLDSGFEKSGYGKAPDEK